MKLIHGDCLEVLPTLPEAGVDAVVTDPPYALGEPRSHKSFRAGCRGDPSPAQAVDNEARRGGFMGKRWDAELPGVEHWQAILRVLKPGGYLLGFGGTRTYHRLTCAVEDAGFEVRDCLMWVYGSGFPKGDACLKPAWEPILLARKPGRRVKPLGVDECRVAGPPSGLEPYTRSDNTGGIWADESPTRFGAGARVPFTDHPAGRYPANVLHDGSGEVLEAFAAFGEKRGMQVSELRRGATTGTSIGGHGRYGRAAPQTVTTGYGDVGTAARFFYCAKASSEERGEGNNHPTVKPLELIRWLVRLVTPKGGTCLDPFMGSGTTGVACVREHREFVGIERDADYHALASRRVRAEEDLRDGRGVNGLFDWFQSTQGDSPEKDTS
jgi:site-specific DNA-methyltransferase (adenine-specific)